METEYESKIEEIDTTVRRRGLTSDYKRFPLPSQRPIQRYVQKIRELGIVNRKWKKIRYT